MTKLEDARSIVRPLLGAKPNPRKLAQAHGISHVTFESAIAIEKAMQARGHVLATPPPIKPPTKVHPVAEMFPLMEGKEFDDLVEDIKANGLANDIVVQKGVLIDGRNRRAACASAGVVPRFREFDGLDPVQFIISQNTKRRHLTFEQRALIAAKLSNLRRGHPSNSAPVQNTSANDAAKLMSVSVRSVQSAKVVLEKADPKVITAVEQGKVAVKRAVEIADLPAEDQRDLVEHMSAEDIVVNHERIKKDRKRKATFERIQAEAQPTQEWPTGRYSVIYADPPTEDDYGHTKRDVEHHYPTMTWDEVKDLAVNIITTEDAVCYLWATPHTIHKSLEVLAAWGFEYRTHAVWDKGQIGLGAWFRNQHELLLVGRKGQFPPPPEDKRNGSVFYAPTTDHSAKPEMFAELIEHWYPDAVKLELFRRGRPRPGWVAWGLETGMVAA